MLPLIICGGLEGVTTIDSSQLVKMNLEQSSTHWKIVSRCTVPITGISNKTEKRSFSRS